MAGEQPPRLEQRPWFWPALAALFALAAIPGIFTTTQVFYVRDLASWFLPHHLWFHHALFTGNLPLWYPYPGCGYATVRDATFQTLFPLTLPLRFLPPILGFNLIVALPFPLTAAGMFLFLRRHVRPAAACLGATVVAASGVFLSTANAPNLSWSAALLPWVRRLRDRDGGIVSVSCFSPESRSRSRPRPSWPCCTQDSEAEPRRGVRAR